MFKNKFYTSLFLFFLFITAIFLRFFNLDENLFFGPEQGIDFFRMKEIVIDHSPVLVGAKTDIAGIFHGPIYFYLSTVPFVLSYGNPLFIAFFLITVNCLTVFLIYFLGKELFNRQVGLISSIFFTLSFGAISYSRWLSSHPLAIPLSALFFLSLTKFMNSKKMWLLVASVSFGLLCQTEFLNYIFFGAIILVIVFLKFNKFTKQNKIFLFVNLLLVIFFSFSHYILFELKNNFIMVKSILGLMHSSEHKLPISIVVKQIYEVFSLSLSKNFIFINGILAIFILILALVILLKSKYDNAKIIILPWTIIPLLLLIILRHGILEQFFVYYVVCSILLISFLIDSLMKWKKYLGLVIFIILFVINIKTLLDNLPSDKNMFFESTQPEVKISDEKAVIDEIYKRQNGKNFSFQSFTIPYWSQEGWEYLFWQYGGSKYNYQPINQNGKTLYVIIQDVPDKNFQNDWLRNTVSKWGKYRDSFKKGIFTVKILDIK